MNLRATVTLVFGMFCAGLAQDSSATQEVAVPTALDSAVMQVQPDTAGAPEPTASTEESAVSESVEGNNVAENNVAATADCNEAETPYNLPCELMPLWNSMTIKQKAAQMVMVYMTPADFMLKHEFGGYLVMKNHLKDLEKFKKNIETVNREMKIPPVVAVDQEGGRVNRIGNIDPKWERTPSAKAMRKMSEDSIRNIAAQIGQELHKLGINMNLAPVLDPSKDSRGKQSFMEESHRSWGFDTTNAPKVRAFVQGMRESGIICVSKHFPGYDSWTNSDHQIAISATPKKSISKNIAFFKTLADDIPVTMMSSVRFVRVSNRPAVFEPQIVKRARMMSPETVILTDDLWGVSLRAWISGTERVKGKNYPAKDFKKLVQTALTSGNDMFMTTFPKKGVDMINYLSVMALQNAKYRKRVEESCARILKMKHKAGLI